jgi:hypothetical protein
MKIKSIKHIKLDEPVRVYDLQIQNNSNFFITKNDINVHNSGKSFTAGEVFGLQPIKGDKDYRTSFSATGLKVVNSDVMFTHLLKKNGINPRDLANISSNDIELAKKIGLIPSNEKDTSILKQ